MRLKKSLGQHFLHDRNIARNIVSLLAPGPGDAVLEIGPGDGALTSVLADSGARLIAVEIDGRAVETLLKSFAGRDNVAIRKADILDCDLSAMAVETGRKLRVIGNLPYNISSRILFHLFDHALRVSDCVLMMQQEVAKRLVSPPGKKDYGILSVITQLHADARIAMRVSPNVFYPKPKVMSSVLHLRFEPERFATIEDPMFLKHVVRSAFGKRRKQLGNALKDIGLDADLQRPGLQSFMRRRAEDLSPAEFVELASSLKSLEGPRAA